MKTRHETERPTGRLVRARSALRNEGLAAFISKLFNATVFRRLVLFERPLFNLVVPERLPLAYPISTLAIEEADLYAQLRPDQGAALCRARMEAGHVCLVMREGERLVAHSWHTARNATIDFLDMSLPLAPDESYRYDLYTASGYRESGLAVGFMDESARQLSAMGYSRVLAAIHAGNGSSIRMTKKVGAVPMGWLGVIRIGRWRKHIVHIDRGKRAPGSPA